MTRIANEIRCGLTRRRYEAMTGLTLVDAAAGLAEAANKSRNEAEAARRAGEAFQAKANRAPQFALPPSDTAFEAAHGACDIDGGDAGRSARAFADLDSLE